MTIIISTLSVVLGI